MNAYLYGKKISSSTIISLHFLSYNKNFEQNLHLDGVKILYNAQKRSITLRIRKKEVMTPMHVFSFHFSSLKFAQISPCNLHFKTYNNIKNF